MKYSTSLRSRLFDICNVLFLASLALTMLLPLISVFAKSFSSSNSIAKGEVFFWPVEFTLINYEYVFHDASIWRAFLVSLVITVGGTFINLLATTSLAYPLSRPEYKGKKIILFMVLFTMIFSAPLIPSYLVVKNFGMVDTLWALIIPSMISAFNFFVMRSFFLNIPSTLIDAARIDGLGELGILFRIVLPLSKPVLATIGIFYGVSHWNSYQTALYYLNDPKLYPLQVKLRQMIVNDEMSVESNSVYSTIALNSPEGIQMATVVIATLPILLLYPFLQKHFVKGTMIGSIKE
jgi:putative aldouronate transport system permease protein